MMHRYCIGQRFSDGVAQIRPLTWQQRAMGSSDRAVGFVVDLARRRSVVSGMADRGRSGFRQRLTSATGFADDRVNWFRARRYFLVMNSRSGR